MKDGKGPPAGEAGQVILILILVMTVALAIGLSVIQRSLSDISTSTKVEQSSRAFSAAEAGIERALVCPSCTSVNFSENQSSATVDVNTLLPAVAGAGSRQAALEYPPLAKEEVAHVWLANPNSTANPPAEFYKQSSLDVYWGNPSATDKAALELTLVYYGGGQYQSQKWFLDQMIRSPANNFDTSANCSGFAVGSNNYQCRKTISFPGPAGLMLLRVRLLYNSTSQPFAVQASGTCGQDCSLPPQARVVVATGVSGQTQRKIQLFQIDKVVPPYFDYAIFSVGAINK